MNLPGRYKLAAVVSMAAFKGNKILLVLTRSLMIGVCSVSAFLKDDASELRHSC